MLCSMFDAPVSTLMHVCAMSRILLQQHLSAQGMDASVGAGYGWVPVEYSAGSPSSSWQHSKLLGSWRGPLSRLRVCCCARRFKAVCSLSLLLESCLCVFFFHRPSLKGHHRRAMAIPASSFSSPGMVKTGRTGHSVLRDELASDISLRLKTDALGSRGVPGKSKCHQACFEQPEPPHHCNILCSAKLGKVEAGSEGQGLDLSLLASVAK